MAKVYDTIDERLRDFIEKQHLFLVATAPLSASGHVNLSPKGLESLRVLGPRQVAYVDFVGSGIETIAHLRENGRIVLLFCAFDGLPKIVRLHGKGRAIEPGEADFEEYLARLPCPFAPRSVIVVDVNRISDSCGFSVPLFDYRGQRGQLGDWADRKGEDGLREYQRAKNGSSIDGLPGLDWVSGE